MAIKGALINSPPLLVLRPAPLLLYPAHSASSCYAASSPQSLTVDAASVSVGFHTWLDAAYLAQLRLAWRQLSPSSPQER